jgi:hypothetical protein
LAVSGAVDTSCPAPEQGPEKTAAQPGRVAPTPPHRSPVQAPPLTPPSLLSHPFSQSYRANLPNSLTNIQPSDERLLTSKTCCGLWYGCRGGTLFSKSPLHFHGRPKQLGWGTKRSHFAAAATPSLLEAFPGLPPALERKDNSSQALGPCLQMACCSRYRPMPPGTGRELSPASLLAQGLTRSQIALRLR